MRATLTMLLLLAACGDGDARLYDDALAALRAGKLREAGALASRAADRGDAAAGFLRGNIAFAQCSLAEKQAEAPAAEPFAWDVAIAYGEKARRFWQDAAMSRPDWPEARRNVERALIKLAELEKKKAAAEDKRRRDSDPQPKPRPRPKPKPRTETEEEQDPKLDPLLKELSREEVLRLIEKLAEKEQEKVALRRSQRTARTTDVERDW